MPNTFNNTIHPVLVTGTGTIINSLVVSGLHYMEDTVNYTYLGETGSIVYP